MKDRPAGVTERDLVHALADGWGLSAETLRYAPVGGGSYHWVVTSDPGEQWFVTVDDLNSPRGEEIRTQSPFNRVATPEEIAAAVLYLASAEAVIQPAALVSKLVYLPLWAVGVGAVILLWRPATTDYIRAGRA